MASIQFTNIKRMPSLCQVLFWVLGIQPLPSCSFLFCWVRQSPTRQAVISDRVSAKVKATSVEVTDGVRG